MAVQVPANVGRVIAILQDVGPLAPGDLADRLAAEGIALNEQRLVATATRFSQHLGIDPDGRITLASGGEHGPVDDVGEREHEAQVVMPPVLPTLSWDDVLTVDRTHGHGGSHAVVTAAMRGQTRSWTVETDEEEAAASQALADFARRGNAKAIAGWQGRGRAAVAPLAADAWLRGLPWADVGLLSVLVDPTQTDRDIRDLVARGGDAHEPSNTAEAVLRTAQSMIAEIDPSEPSWQLAIATLTASGSVWGQLLPDAATPRIGDALFCARDPLLSRGAGIDAFTTVRGVEELTQQLPARMDKHMRPQQLEMALAVAKAFDAPGDLAVEAPTGTGKTLAYLVPAAIRGSRTSTATVVATHTKVLQRQVRREVQALRDAGLFAPPFRQLFGVSNYVCTREVADAIGVLLDRRSKADDVGAGSVSERLAVGESLAVAIRALAVSENGVWDDVTDQALTRSSRDYALARSRLATDPAECERKECAWAKQCPMMLRRVGMDDDPGVISTNHAVIATWAANPETAPSVILGPESVAGMVFDEAHRLEDSVTSAWTETTGLSPLAALVFDLARSRGRVGRCIRDLRADGVSTKALEELRQEAGHARSAVMDLQTAVQAYVHEYAGKEQRIELRKGVVDARPEYARVRDAGMRVNRLLSQAMDHLGEMDAQIRQAISDTGTTPARRRAWRTLKSLHRRCVEQRELLTALVDLKEGHIYVHLLHAEPGDDDHPADWSFERIPIEIAARFHALIQRQVASLVLTSATLRVAGSFAFITERLGLDLNTEASPDAELPQRLPRPLESLALSSPFDFDRQSVVILSSHLPVPVPANEDEFCEAAAAETIGFLSLSRGRTLSLYAARVRMEKVVEGVRTREGPLAERGVTLLVQGENPPSEIQARFVHDEGTALFGLQSYWEGFDAPGCTLSFVQIEKAPYPPPHDPLISARSRAVSARGGDPFLDYVVPRTAISLAQGFGRLIRGPEDRGAAFLLDRRLQHPTSANDVLLGTLPTTNFHIALDRDDGWSTALSFVDGVEPDLTQALDAPASVVMEALERLALDFDLPLEPQLALAARELFAIDQLLPEQIELMVATLMGRDAMGILPTGTGKSLTFQLPAVLRADGRPTVVISPLVALIKDQVDDLRARRGLRVVSGITGRTSGAERTELLRDMADGRIRLLYVAPERLTSDLALRTALESRELGVLVVDEAHCISSWGHDFRPEFRQIARSVEEFHVDATLALTATATPEVEGDVVASLRMKDPVVVRRAVTRPDLRYRVLSVGSDRDRVREILRLHESDRAASGLIYVTRRALADEVAWILRQAGIGARAYHAGMEPGQRESVQDDFLDGTTQVVVATKAFGMGVNKPDIDWVVHYDAPESLEAYVQEAGRAARDSALTGDAVLLVGRGDIVRHRKMIGMDTDQDRMQRVDQVWRALVQAKSTGDRDVEFDPDALADGCGLSTEEMATALGWLEQTGHVARLPDAAVAGMLAPGRGEPEEATERHLFRRLTLEMLQMRAGQRRRIEDLGVTASVLGVERNRLERLLIDWTMRRFVTFQPTRKRWRVHLLRESLEPATVTRLLHSWRRSQHRRLDELQAYAEHATGPAECRRVLVARTFGDPEHACTAVPGAQECDVCANERPVWHTVPLERVPDPERLVDIEVVVLQAVRWATSYAKGRYGEVGLMRAILGEDQYPSGRPLSAGLLACPQFGALKYLRGAERRLKTQMDKMMNAGLLARESTQRDGNEYTSLMLTDAGLRALTGAAV